MKLPPNSYLGKLCPRHHDHDGTGRSLRRTYNRHCIACFSEMRRKRWREDAAFRARQAQKDREKYERKRSDPEFIKQNRAKTRRWFREVHPHKMATDPQYRQRRLLRDRVRKGLQIIWGKGKVPRSRELGLDYAAIFEHLGPCPGKPADYHIDHIRPLASYPDLRDPAQIAHALAPENHQWLPKSENLRKHAKWSPTEDQVQPWDQGKVVAT